jgi:hypothetical protein
MPQNGNGAELDTVLETQQIPQNMIPKPETLTLNEMLERRAQQAQIYRKFFPNWDTLTFAERDAIHWANLLAQAPPKKTMSAIDWAQAHNYDFLDAERRAVRHLNGKQE